MADFNTSFRDYLIALAVNNRVISEVFLVDSNMGPGEPDLTGVTIRDVELNFVEFVQAGTGGMGVVLVPIDKILLVEV